MHGYSLELFHFSAILEKMNAINVLQNSFEWLNKPFSIFTSGSSNVSAFMGKAGCFIGVTGSVFSGCGLVDGFAKNDEIAPFPLAIFDLVYIYCNNIYIKVNFVNN